MTREPERETRVLVIGAGPAGLTAAYELTRFNVRPAVLEKSASVGGLARTESYKGFRFDLGGHRFFSKVDEVNKLDSVALGMAAGSVTGVVLFLATLGQALVGPSELTPYLDLLGQYFPGFRVSVAGSLLGLVYGAAAGFAAGWAFACARNAAMAVYLAVTYGRAERTFLRRLFDYI